MNIPNHQISNAECIYVGLLSLLLGRQIADAVVIEDGLPQALHRCKHLSRCDEQRMGVF